MAGRESPLQRRIQAALKEKVGGYWIKIWTGPYQVTGFPDLLGCVDGFFFAFEVKPGTEKPTKKQISVMNKIKKAGGCTGVVRSPVEAIKLVRSTLSESR